MLSLCVRPVLVAACVSGFLVACGGGGSSSGGGGREARFSLDPVVGPSCPNADRVTQTNDLFNCQWNCATHKGRTGIVSISFRKLASGRWELFDEVVSSPCP